MADRELFRWKDAAIMGKDRPQYVTVGPDFPGGSPVWGENGVIAALLARVAEVEAERDRLRERVAQEAGTQHAKAMGWWGRKHAHTANVLYRILEEARRAE